MEEIVEAIDGVNGHTNNECMYCNRVVFVFLFREELT